MESNFNNRDFEQFVKSNADQYRMFPSEKVWKGIHGALHTRRRWYGAGIVLLFLTVSAVTWVMLNPPTVKQITSGNAVITSKADDNLPAQKLTAPGMQIQPQTKNSLSLFPIIDQKQSLLPINNGNDLIVIPVQGVIETERTAPPVLQNRSSANVIAYNPININITDQATDNNLFNPDNLSFDSPFKEKRESFPLSIESVVNLFKTKNSRFSFQLYFTPTVSYRKLRENKAYTQSSQLANAPLRFAAASNKDINNVVTHKPALGFELGFSTGYQLSNDLKIKAGLQFNVSRYDIKAYTHSSEIATIALNRGVDSINAWTHYRNFDGYKSDWLQNLYFSISLPVGIELKIAGDKKTNIGISGTLQPTYIISDKAYVISSDYKNYAEIPSLIRRWNLSTSIEPYVGYSTGKLSWQIGPQVRYQLLSSFQKKYPVKENVFDFGLKVGVMLNH